ncbi:ASCH domain-containing protein [Pseudooceanicola marinus]
MISIHSDYAKSIVRGVKTVELRRRFMALPNGSRLWIYSTLPVGALVATAVVAGIDCDKPENLWNRYQSEAAVSKQAFFDYFLGCKRGAAIRLTDVEEICPVPLSRIRSIRGVNHIPQVATRLSSLEARRFEEIGCGL